MKHIDFDEDGVCKCCKRVGIDIYKDKDGYFYQCKCGHEWGAHV